MLLKFSVDKEGKKKTIFLLQDKFIKTKLMWTFLIIFVVVVLVCGLNKSDATCRFQFQNCRPDFPDLVTLSSPSYSLVLLPSSRLVRNVFTEAS